MYFVLLLLRIALAPLLIALATLAQHRWGPEAGGRLLGLPMLSAPVVLVLDLQHGTGFAELAARGTLAGTASAAAFAAAYAHAAPRRPGLALLAGVGAFALATLVLSAAHLSLALLALLVAVAVLAALRSWPAPGAPAPTPPEVTPSAGALRPTIPAWELGLRMAVATAASYGLTASATVLGPHIAGLLSPFPLLTTILALFARHRGGPATALAVVRGMLSGLVGFTACFAVICAALPRLGLLLTFGAGLALALAAQSRPVLRASGSVPQPVR